MTVLKLAEGRGFIEAGIKVFEDAESDGQRAGTARRVPTEDGACCQEVLKEKKSMSHQPLVLDIKSSSSNRSSPPLVLDIRDDNPVDSSTVQK